MRDVQTQEDERRCGLYVDVFGVFVLWDEQRECLISEAFGNV